MNKNLMDTNIAAIREFVQDVHTSNNAGQGREDYVECSAVRFAGVTEDKFVTVMEWWSTDNGELQGSSYYSFEYDLSDEPITVDDVDEALGGGPLLQTSSELEARSYMSDCKEIHEYPGVTPDELVSVL